QTNAGAAQQTASAAIELNQYAKSLADSVVALVNVIGGEAESFVSPAPVKRTTATQPKTRRRRSDATFEAEECIPMDGNARRQVGSRFIQAD
ncbi:MAG TPA: hypothetical protein VM680_13140, partial [Verrucomicrobiae bacterium]|nr:hypothetical protein [Verrucomicrobiae bacterium]